MAIDPRFIMPPGAFMASPQPPPFDAAAWVKRIEEGYPPPREVLTRPAEMTKGRNKLPATYLGSPENDPLVIQFLTDVLGEMVGVATALRLDTGLVHAYGHGDDDPRTKAAYGTRMCVWAPKGEPWHLTYKGSQLVLHCGERPSDDDMAKLIFVMGWWTLRTSTYANRDGVWRHISMSNAGELGRKV